MPKRKTSAVIVQGDHIQSAIISRDLVYRYMLTRYFPRGYGVVVFVMLNPSKADGLVADPTFRRCVGFAQKMGFRAMVIVNLYAARSTEPDALLEMDDPVGPLNDEYIIKAVKLAEEVICGWGTHRATTARARHVYELIKLAGKQPKCLQTTDGGKPKHPLYIKADAKLEAYHGD